MALKFPLIKRVLLFGVLPLLLAVGALAWVERHELLSRWYLHKLRTTRGPGAAGWAGKLAGLGERAIPDALDLMASDDADLCANGRAVFAELATTWGLGDPRCQEMQKQAIAAVGHLSEAGKIALVQQCTEWCADEQCPANLATTCGLLLVELAPHAEGEMLDRTLDLAVAALTRSSDPAIIRVSRDLAGRGLKAKESSLRARAIHLAIQPEIELRREVVPLVSDPEPLVRRAAILAIGEYPDLIHTDNLLAWLHDPDAEVRRLCEQALRSERRGNLSADFIRLGKLVTDSRWQVRAAVLDELEEAQELDPAAWLRRLSADPSPAVRAAAVRAFASSDANDRARRLESIARTDPSPTVADLARYYRQKCEQSVPR